MTIAIDSAVIAVYTTTIHMSFIFRRNIIIIGFLLFAVVSMVLCSGSFLSFGTVTHCNAGAGSSSHAQLMEAMQQLVIPTAAFILLLLLVVLAYQMWAALQLLPVVLSQRLYSVNERSPGSIRASLYLMSLLRSGVINPKIY